MERTHHQLKVWQRSIELVSHIYAITHNFPKRENYALTAQMRRSAVSIPSNIAEGAARRSVREFRNFLSVARGSLSELETQIIISQRLGYLKQDTDIEERIEEIFRMLAGLLKNVKDKE